MAPRGSQEDTTLSGEDGSSASSNFTVCVRIRPPSMKEAAHPSYRTVVSAVDQNMVVFDPKSDNQPTFFNTTVGQLRRDPRVLKRRERDLRFAFDHVFGPDATQNHVFEHTTKPIVEGVLNGYNASVFCYGATGAGKTHTMLGHNGDPGVILLTLEELFSQIESRKDEMSCEVAVSYLEVYNENIRDLLEPANGLLAIREDANNGVVVAGLSVHRPKGIENLLTLLQTGNSNRTQHPTDANATSSRSHAVFTIHVHQQPRTANITTNVRMAKMTLIDLAGSERASASNNMGARMREGSNINRSLLALGNCINALAAGGGKKTAHVPYRNSKLTRILKDSLGGNCRTVMIANCSPSHISYEDTYNTLQYANRAKQIKVNISQNVVNVDYHLARYTKIVHDLRAEISELKHKLANAKGQTLSSAALERQRNQLQGIFDGRAGIIQSIVEAEAAGRERESDLRKLATDLQRAEWMHAHAADICGADKIEALKNEQQMIMSSKVAVEREMLEAQKQLGENNCKSEAWQESVEVSVGAAELEVLKWEYRCRALEQENAGLQRRNAALMNDVRHECKESKRTNRVVASLLKALVSARTQLRESNPAYDSTVIENAMRLAVTGKEVLWPDRSSFDQAQTLLVGSPEVMHTPTGADAKARAPMRSISRSISRSKLAVSVTAVSAIGSPTANESPDKAFSPRTASEDKSAMTPLQLRTPSHWVVPAQTGKLSSTPVQDGQVGAPGMVTPHRARTAGEAVKPKPTMGTPAPIKRAASTTSQAAANSVTAAPEHPEAPQHHSPTAVGKTFTAVRHALETEPAEDLNSTFTKAEEENVQPIVSTTAEVKKGTSEPAAGALQEPDKGENKDDQNGGSNTAGLFATYAKLTGNNNIRREGSLRRLNGAAKSVGAKKPLAPANAQVSTGTGPVPRYMQGTAATKARVKGIA